MGTGKLMYRFRNVKAFFFSSTCSVYQSQGEHKLKESDPLGVKAKFVYLDQMIPGSPCDTTLMHELVGETHVDWREGM